MEELESKFEELLIKTKNTNLIDAYSDLKLELGKVLQKAATNQDLLIEKIEKLRNGR